MAWTVAPRRESKSEPASPAQATSGKRDQLLAKRATGNAIIAAPNSDAQVPHDEIPPDVPFSTRFFKSVIRRGEVEFKTPNSVPHVSALTAASAAVNPIQGRIDSGYTVWSTAKSVANPPFPKT